MLYQGCVTGIYEAGARNPAENLVIIGEPPMIRNCLVQTVNSAEVMKLWSKLLEIFLPQFQLPAGDLYNSSDYNLYTSNNYNSNGKNSKYQKP